MFSPKITSNIDKVAKAFDKLGGQVPFATSLALNRTAEFAKSALRVEISRVFDRPKPFVVNSIFIKRASKTNLTARVFHSDKVSPYLKAEIEGGVRQEKRFEVKFGKDILVPTKNVKLDSYGGVSKAFIAKVLSQAAPLRSRTQYVVVKERGRGKLEPGIYERTKDGKIRALFLIKSTARYEQRYDMQAVAQRMVQMEFGRQFAAAMDYALGSARLKL